MEQPKSLEQLMNSSSEALKKFSEPTFLNKIPENEISLYSGPLTPRALVECSVKMQKAFPSLTPGFFEVLNERIKENGFSDSRLKDAVDYVVDNCIYPAPTIAQFISWDRRIKVLTFEDMIKKVNELGGDAIAGKIFAKQYAQVKFPTREKAVWVHVDDIKMYNLKIENPDGTK